MFIRGMSDTIKAKLKHFGVENLEPGDILLTNDAYTTGSHLNHMTFSIPIFDRGQLVAFSSCMAHWQDVGGTLHGMTTDIYSRAANAHRQGLPCWRPNEDIFAIIKMNVRLPERAMVICEHKLLPSRLANDVLLR